MTAPYFTRATAIDACSALDIDQHTTLTRPTAHDLAWLRSRLNADRRESGRRYVTHTSTDTVTITRIAADTPVDAIRAKRPMTIRDHLMQMRSKEVRLLPGVRATSVANAVVTLRHTHPHLRFAVEPLRDRLDPGVRVTCLRHSREQPPSADPGAITPRWRGLVAIVGADAINACKAFSHTTPSRVVATLHPRDPDTAVVVVRAPWPSTTTYWQAQVAAVARKHGGATQTDTPIRK